MRRLRTLALSLVTALAAAPAAADAQRVIDFSGFRSDTTIEYQATPGGQVNSQGMSFYAAFSGGARNALGSWGTDAAQDPVGAANLPTNLGPTAAALWATQFGDRMDMETDDGRLFRLYSLDVAHMFNRSYLVTGDLAPITLVFYGFNADGQNTLASAFLIPAPAIVGGAQEPVLQRLTFSNEWRNLSQVAWFQQSGPFNAGVFGSTVSHQFTNVAVGIVPEPSTYLLLGSGLAGVLVVVRRRRTR